MNENREKIPVGDLKTLEDAIDAAKATLKGEDAVAMKAELEKLQKALFKVSEEMYKNAPKAEGANGGGAAGGDEKKPEGDVIEAEFEDADKT